MLLVHGDWLEGDIDGWNISSFFLVGTEISQEVLNNDKDIINPQLQFSDFAVGEVLELSVNGKTLIADHNASPYMVYINKRDIW